MQIHVLVGSPFFILQIYISQCQIKMPTVHGLYVFDLYYSGAGFDNLAGQWSVSILSASGQEATTSRQQCSLIRGPDLPNDRGLAFKRTYTGLSPHAYITFFILVGVVDVWEAEDYFEIQVDGLRSKKIFGLPFRTNNPSGLSLCPSSTIKHYKDPTSGFFTHTGGSITVTVTSSIFKTSSVASIGMRHLTISLWNQPLNKPDSICARMSSYYTPDRCGCLERTKYPDPTNPDQCLPCHVDCESCFGPTIYECHACHLPAVFDGEKCARPCSSSCLFCTQGGSFCTNCNSGWLTQSDGQCVTVAVSCTPPYIAKSIAQYGFCIHPCQDTNEYILADNTCTPTCDYPMRKRTFGTATFCDKPCPSNKPYLLDMDQTCQATCAPPYVIVSSLLCLTPCQQTDEYMLADKTCIPTCNYPMVKKTVGTAKFCDSPCPPDKPFFHDEDSTCQAKCEHPKILVNSILCTDDIPSAFIQSLGKVYDASQQVGDISAILLTVASFQNPGFFFLQTMTRLVLYVKYMKIAYPPRLNYIIERQGANKVFGAPSEAPESVKSLVVKITLPGNFSKHHHSDFLVNFWSSLIYLSVLLSLIGATALVIRLKKRSGSVQKYGGLILQCIKWNLFIAVFNGEYGNIALYSFLEFYSPQLTTPLTIFSFVLCIVFNILAVLFITQEFIVIYKITTPEASPKDGRFLARLVGSIRITPDDYRVVFETFKDKSFIKQAFMILYTIRFYALYIIISCLHGYPLVQAALINILSLTTLEFLIFNNPLKQSVFRIQYLVQEFVFQLVNICVLGLAICDNEGIENYEARLTFGDIIIACNIFLSLFATIWFIVHICSVVGKLIKARIQLPRGSKVRPSAKSLVVQTNNTIQEAQTWIMHNSPEPTLHDEKVLNTTNSQPQTSTPIPITSSKNEEDDILISPVKETPSKSPKLKKVIRRV